MSLEKIDALLIRLKEADAGDFNFELFSKGIKETSKAISVVFDTFKSSSQSDPLWGRDLHIMLTHFALGLYGMRDIAKAFDSTDPKAKALVAALTDASIALSVAFDDMEKTGRGA